jgi:hypothetical protein
MFLRRNLPSLVLVAGVSAASAQSQLYRLDAASSFVRGCFDGCACPVSTFPLLGTFRLEFVEFDGLFNIYAVTDVNLTASMGADAIPIHGGGTYRIGGEFALTHQLELDLLVGDEPKTRYDSDVLVGGVEFPDIEIAIDMNDLGCTDTVITFVASPACEGDLDEDGDRDLEDLALLLGEFGTQCAPCVADINGDGSVDLADLAIMLAGFGEPCDAP